MDQEGTIRRESDGSIVVEAPLDAYLKTLADVETSGALVRKTFRKKAVYLPSELDQAIKDHLDGHDVMRLAVNGYSNLTPEHCQVWGVQVGAYEQAVAALLEAVTLKIQRQFKGVDVRYLHGASAMGVDASIMQVAKTLNRPNLGFSCPKFMFHVADDDTPVYVAVNQASYAEAFARSTDILIAANGRAQALQHDLMAALLYGKEVLLVNVLRTISTTGGPPAIGPGGKIEDAVDAFLIRVHGGSAHRSRRQPGPLERDRERDRRSRDRDLPSAPFPGAGVQTIGVGAST